MKATRLIQKLKYKNVETPANDMIDQASSTDVSNAFAKVGLK